MERNTTRLQREELASRLADKAEAQASLERMRLERTWLAASSSSLSSFEGEEAAAPGAPAEDVVVAAPSGEDGVEAIAAALPSPPHEVPLAPRHTLRGNIGGTAGLAWCPASASLLGSAGSDRAVNLWVRLQNLFDAAAAAR